MDGVPGFSGHAGRIAPMIAPRDSFEARFTPPRSGTFIYHPHADEVRQQQAGLSGTLLVVDDPAKYAPVHDIPLLISTPRREAEGDRVLRPSMVVRLVRDSLPLTWRMLAKDGMDLPAERALVGPAVQQIGNGETYDYEFVPAEAGELRLTVSAAVGTLLVAMPVRVR